MLLLVASPIVYKTNLLIVNMEHFVFLIQIKLLVYLIECLSHRLYPKLGHQVVLDCLLIAQVSFIVLTNE